MGGLDGLVSLAGAIALLLWGLRMVRRGMMRAFGPNLRTALSRAAQNRVLAFFSGLLTSTTLQSSTATAGIVASFSGRGLIAVSGALAIMLGADVGAALASGVVALDVRWLSPALIAVGFLAFTRASSATTVSVGRAAIGLGLVLLSVKLVSGATLPLRQAEVLPSVLMALSQEPVIVVLGAALLTWLCHSSVAMVLLLLSLFSAGVVPLPVAIAFILGINVGGAVPAVILMLKEPPAARRVALGNLIFRTIGAIVALPFTPLIIEALGSFSLPVGAQIVALHITFNLAVALCFLPFTSLAANLLQKLAPDAPRAESAGTPKHLDPACLENPNLALACASREALRMADLLETMLSKSLTAMTGDDPRVADEVEELDDAVDSLQEAIKFYLAELMRQDLSETEHRRVHEIANFTTNLEHAGDIIERNLMPAARRRMKRHLHFSNDGVRELTELHSHLRETLRLGLGAFMSGDLELARAVVAEKAALRALERATVNSHYKRLRDGRVESMETSALHLDVVRDLKRIHTHLCAPAYPLLEEAGALHPTRLRPHESAAPHATTA